jgi:hypothetical protein
VQPVQGGEVLSPEDDAAAEASMAIAQTYAPAAFHVLRTAFAEARDPRVRTAARLAMICSSGFAGSPNKASSSISTLIPSA